MKRIDLFKRHMEEKRAVKVIAGIDNFDMESVKKVVTAADQTGASAVDICADENIIKAVREMTDMPVFVSSIVPSELARAVELGADAIELGNFDVLYKAGKTFTANEVLELAKETLALLKAEQANGVRGLMERVELTISNTIELVRNVDIPVMTATGINPTTAPFAFAAGACAIGCGSCINKLSSEIAMIATSKQLVEIAAKNAEKTMQLV